MKLSFKYIQNYFFKNVDKFIAFVKLKTITIPKNIFAFETVKNLQKSDFFVEKCSVYRYWPC